MQNKNKVALVVLVCLLTLIAKAGAQHSEFPQTTKVQQKNKASAKDSIPAKNKKSNKPFRLTSAGGVDQTSRIKKVVLDGREVPLDSLNKGVIDFDKIKNIGTANEGDSICVFFYTEDRI